MFQHRIERPFRLWAEKQLLGFAKLEAGEDYIPPTHCVPGNEFRAGLCFRNDRNWFWLLFADNYTSIRKLDRLGEHITEKYTRARFRAALRRLKK